MARPAPEYSVEALQMRSLEQLYLLQAGIGIHHFLVAMVGKRHHRDEP